MKSIEPPSLTARRGRFGRVVPVTPERETKSVSSETTLDVDLARFEELEPILWRLCEKTSGRLKA